LIKYTKSFSESKYN